MLKSRIKGAGFYVIIFHRGYLKKNDDTIFISTCENLPLQDTYETVIIISGVFFGVQQDMHRLNQ
jgi:hypothetical protein